MPALHVIHRSFKELASVAVSLVVLGLPATAFAASFTLTPSDPNRGIGILDSLADATGTSLLYFTYPEAGQPQLRDTCNLGVYRVDLAPGLAGAEPRRFGESHCASRFGLEGRLLDSGEIMLVAADQAEIWDAEGNRLLGWNLGDASAGSGIQANINEPITRAAVSRDGSVVLAGNVSGGAVVVVGLTRDGTPRFEVEIRETDAGSNLEGLWAKPGGGALVHVMVGARGAGSLPLGPDVPAGAIVSRENRFYSIDPTGQVRQSLVLVRDQQPDYESLEQAPGPLDPDAFRNLLSLSVLEGIRQLAVAGSDDGSYEILVDRDSQNDVREGHFWYSLAPDGAIAEERSLTEAFAENGLGRWTDLARDGRDVVVFGMVSVRQNVGTRRAQLEQGSVSRVNVDADNVVTRLLPVDERFVEPYLNARDEEVQNLDGLPVGMPAHLARLGSTPLAVSIGFVADRAVIRLDEVEDTLPLFTGR